MAIFAKFCEAGAMSRTKLKTGTSSRAELQGLDATDIEATNRTTLSPISPNGSPNHVDDKGTDKEGADEVDEIDKLLERVEELEEQLEREGKESEVKVVQDVETPTQEQIDRHEATHTPYRRWCKECNKGLAIRDKHAKKKKVPNRNKIPDTEEAKNGQVKFSMDYMTMDSIGGDKAPASLVLVNHEDGGIFSYGTVGKGIQGDKY